MRRLLTGMVLGAVGWLALRAVLPGLPVPVRFIVAWTLFTIGPGLGLGARLTRGIDPLMRTIVLLGLGSAGAPLLIDVLGRLHELSAFPYLAAALAGVGLAEWRQPGGPGPRVMRSDIAACALIVGVALGTGAIVFAHRLVTTPDGIQLFGDYDSFDMSFYAAWASEATHTVPPMASFYSGHELNGAYYPQLVLAMTHRFAAVPLLSIYFFFAWPTFLALGGLVAYAFARSLVSAGTALLAVVLIIVGGDLSYLAAWYLPHATDQWDYVLWPTNFLAPTMEVLHFNTWGPTLPVFFMFLYSVARAAHTRSRGWIVASAALLAVLFEFKPFAYIVAMGGLCATALFSGRDAAGRRQSLVTIGLTGLFTLPLVLGLASPEDRRSRLLLAFFVLPQRMLIKLDLVDAFEQAATRLAPFTFLRQPLLLTLATVLFLTVGPGLRLFGIAGVWRAIRGDGQPEGAAWRLTGWCIVAAVALPFVVSTDPYVDTLQFYQTGLFLLWIVTALALTRFARRHRVIGTVAICVAVASTLPSSIHYLTRKWTDNQRSPLAALSRAEAVVASQLATTDPESTVFLNDSPLAPSLMTVVSGRRTVLAWGHPYYAVGSNARARDVNSFYGSANGAADLAIDVLRRYHVTHVVVHPDRDRVHPGVLAHLRPVLQFPDVVLYEVRSLPEP